MSNHTVLIRKDKKEILIEDSSAPIIDKDNKIVGVVIIFRDYTEKWERLKQIEYLGYHDELTGLFNRRYYELEVNRLDIKRNLPLSLVMGDVNGLKLINDSFGHEVGDALLTKVANAIKAECRMEDIAARLGGDEFVIILPHTDELGTEKFIQRIMNNLTNEKVNGIDLSVSFGFDIKRNEEQNMQVLFKNAEDSMYRQKIHESTSIRSKTIDVIASTLFAKSDREHIHSEKVSSLCEQLSKSIGLNKNKVNQLRLAGLMHDIGKIGIEDKILNKPGKLTEAEYYEIKKHSEIGYRILRSVNEFSEISEFILEHHEKWDGTGYPQGLKGEEIKLEARIVSLADADDAMTTQRTYHDAFSKKSAINEIKRCSGTQFDPDIVKVFIEQVLNVS
jgi:diguanylate cyclase (GGDEF)-like protein/putative nucleotidyltransferase with HDIG domain